MKQRFTDKYPVLGLLINTYGGFLVSEFLVGLIVTLALSNTEIDQGTAIVLGGCIGSILVLISWYLKNRPKYRFMPREGEISGSFKLLIFPMLLYWVLLFGLYAYYAKGFPFLPIGFEEILTALMAGLVEEICFREIAISFMAKHWISEKRIPVIAVISGVLFGLTHISNIITGSPFDSVLSQSVLCIFMGVFYSAVYLRKGNVWTLCLIHAFHDVLTFMAVAGLRAKGVAELPDWTTIYIMAIEFTLFLFGFYYIRKEKRQEIVDLWDYKWSRDQNKEDVTIESK